MERTFFVKTALRVLPGLERELIGAFGELDILRQKLRAQVPQLAAMPPMIESRWSWRPPDILWAVAEPILEAKTENPLYRRWQQAPKRETPIGPHDAFAILPKIRVYPKGGQACVKSCPFQGYSPGALRWGKCCRVGVWRSASADCRGGKLTPTRRALLADLPLSGGGITEFAAPQQLVDLSPAALPLRQRHRGCCRSRT
jgi:hypothetical protein